MAQKLNVLYLLVKKPDIPFVVFQKLRMGCYAVKCRIGKERHKNNNTNQLQGKQAYTKSDKCKRIVIETATLFINADFNMFVYYRLRS